MCSSQKLKIIRGIDMFTTLLYIACSLLGIFIVSWFMEYASKNKHLKNVPGPTRLPIIGSAYVVLYMSEILEIVIKFTEKYGSTFKGMTGFETQFMTSDVGLIESVSNSTKLIAKSLDYFALRNWLGEGLLTSTGAKWTKKRKLLTPAFHFNILEQFIDVFNSVGDILVQKLNVEIGKEATDIHPYITLCTLDIIYEATMGIKVQAQMKENSAYVKAVKAITCIIYSRLMHPLKRFKYFYVFSRDYWKEKEALQILHGTTDSVIRCRREMLLKREKSANDSEDGGCNLGIKKRMAFLDILLQANIDGHPLADHEIREQVDTFLFEGHDTTSSAISFALYNICTHPDVQNKIVQELKSIFGENKHRPMTNEDLQNMKYLEMVIKETLRLYPSVPIVARHTYDDFQHGDLTIPAGVNVYLVLYMAHRNSAVFPDTEKFDPERFSAENRTKISPYAYIPFSAGPRNCIGQKFAMLEVKSVLSKILMNFELLAVKNFIPKLVSELILRSDNGMMMQIKKRLH